MEYKIRIEKEFPFYLGYINGRYLEGSCAWTKWGCKRNIRQNFKDTKSKYIEEYVLKI